MHESRICPTTGLQEFKSVLGNDSRNVTRSRIETELHIKKALIMSYSDCVLAYLDPGTGAIVLQAIAAVVLTIGVVFRKAIFAPATFFRHFVLGKKDANGDETTLLDESISESEPEG